MTQSAISKALAALRAELGDPLLPRRGDTMVLTPRAERLAPRLADALRNLRDVVADSEEASLPGAVTIAMRDQFALVMGPRVIAHVRAESPNTTVRFVPYDRERIGSDLARGVADLAIAVEPPELPGLRTSKLYSDGFVCVAPRRKRLSLVDYLAADHVVTSAHAGFAGVDAALRKLGHTRRVVAYTSFFSSSLALADQLGLFATLPSRVARVAHLEHTQVFPLPFEVPRFSVWMVWDARFDVAPASVWLRDLVRRSRE